MGQSGVRLSSAAAPALAHTDKEIDKEITCAHPVTTASYGHITSTELCFPRGALRTPLKAGYLQHSGGPRAGTPQCSQVTRMWPGTNSQAVQSKPCPQGPDYSLSSAPGWSGSALQGQRKNPAFSSMERSESCFLFLGTPTMSAK